ncbi:MAG TPA: ABC transporter permease subunit [Pseudoflavonifractor sp.]|nr:ABC transporter permease subunit [Pseudoflavonifractor sp.]
MNDAAYTIGVPSGSTAVNAVESALPKAKMKYYNSLSDAYLAVQQGKVDAFAFDRYLLGFAIANGLDGVKVLPGDVGTTDDVAVGISRKSGIPDLQQKINGCLLELRTDGALDDMFERWVVNADDTMPDIPKPEHPTMTLIVGTSGLVQPFSYYQGNELIGYDLEMAARLALYLNADLEIKVYDYDGFPSAAESGAIDCILANLNATPERRETMDFSTPLYQTQTALLVQDDGGLENEEKQASASDTQRVPVESARIGVMEGSTNEIYAKEHYPDANLMSFKNYVDSTAALDAGKLDYAMMDYTSALRFIRSNRNLEIASGALTDEKVCLGISKNQPELAQKVSSRVDKYLADGAMDEIISHWIKPDASDYDVVETPKLTGAPKIKVAIIASREPTTFLLNGQYAGLDIELIDRVLYELGYQAEYLDMELGAVIASIDSNKADMTLGMYNTPERAEKLLFTAPYFSNPQVLVTRQEIVTDTGVPQYTALNQLSGKVVSCQTGSIADILIDSVVPNVTYSYFNNRTDMLAALENGKVEAMSADEPVAKLSVAQTPALTILPERIVEDHYGIALQKDSPLTAQVNDAIARLKADGTLEAMKEKWTGADESVKILPQLDYPGANGTLRVAHDIAAEPMEYVGAGGEPVGYDLELMLRIGEILDRKVEFTGVDFSGLIPMLQSGKADAAVGCMSIADERKKTVDMSDSYYESGLYFVVRKVTVSAKTEEGFGDRLKASFTRTFLTENRWKLVLDGLEVTVLISICSGLLGSLMGFGICMLRRSKKRIAALPAAAFIRLIQGTPIVVLLMILYYIIFGKLDISAILVAIFGFAVNFGVYVSEMMRTGINAVDKGQIEAAHALGFTKVKTFCKITFPQAARHFLPVFKGEFISMVKMTSVVGYIAIQDLTKVSDIIRSRTLEAFFPLIATAVIYFLVANVLTMLLSRLEIGLDPKRRKRAVKGVVMR